MLHSYRSPRFSVSLGVILQSSWAKKATSPDLLATCGRATTEPASAQPINNDAMLFPCAEFGLKTLCCVMDPLNENSPPVSSGWKKLFKKILRSPPNFKLCERMTLFITELNDHCVSDSRVVVQ